MRIGSDSPAGAVDSPEGAVVGGTATELCTESGSTDGDIVGSEEVSRLEKRLRWNATGLVGPRS